MTSRGPAPLLLDQLEVMAKRRVSHRGGAMQLDPHRTHTAYQITLLRNSPPSKNWSSQEKSGSARKEFFIENKTTHRVLTCEVSELRYFNAWQPRIPAKSTCGGYAVELVLGSTLVNVLV